MTTSDKSLINNQDNRLLPTLWLIDDDPALRLILEDTFKDANINVISFANAHGAWIRLNQLKAEQAKTKTKQETNEYPHAVLTDIRMPMMDGLSFSDWLNREFPEIPVIIMTAHSDLQSAIDSYQIGAFEYLPKPFDLDEAVSVVLKAIRRNKHYQRQLGNQPSKTPKRSDLTKQNIKTRQASQNKQASNNQASNKQGSAKQPYISQSKTSKQQIIGQSPAMQAVYRAIGRLADSPITVLITGESGTGKELVANALHQTSPRCDNPFIALNMSAIPHDLIESELFGHEKGAFTGATTTRKGRFEQANGGTLFLDEIGDMPFSTQTRLLRVLANGEFFRVGGKDPIKVDVRIVSATHQNLEDLVKQGKFREDLFYRLNVIRLQLPALRERGEDIPDLIAHFIDKASKELNSEHKQISDSAMQVLQSYHWSGNVRQLENACRWLTVMTSGNKVMIDDLPPELLSFYQSNQSSQPSQISQSDKLSHAIDSDTQPASQLTPDITSIKGATDASHINHVSNISDINNISHVNHSNNVNSANSINSVNSATNWQTPLEQWATEQVKQGELGLLDIAVPDFERIMINTALLHCKGHKGKASKLLGWGRNTLTRKIALLGLDDRW